MIDQSVFLNKKAAYYTLGCKLNFAETSTIGKMLAEQGIRKVRPGEKADICVINTCSVTELADKKCRQAIRRLAHQHPGAFVVVTGCYAQLKPEEVDVEAYYGTVNAHNEIISSVSEKMHVLENFGNGNYRYGCEVTCKVSGRFGLTGRIKASGKEWDNSVPGFMCWPK